MSTWPNYLANRPHAPNADLPVLDKYSGAIIARVALPDAVAVEQAIAAAVAAEAAMRTMPADARQAVLLHCVQRLAARADELAQVLCSEAGKPIRDARGEVTRLLETFRIAAAETLRDEGAVLNLQIGARTRSYRGFTKRVPRGACALITPFNFPLNLVAHKVAPAIAAGCPFVLKPSEKTPLGALILGEVLAECELPPGAFSILPLPGASSAPLVEDERLKLLSFTGGQIGWALKARAGRKPVLLELGGNAACIVDGDQGGCVDAIVPRIVNGAFYQSGQSCISVQRILVQRALYEDFRTRFVAAAQTLVVGDPRDERTAIGPVIDDAAAARLRDWLAQARAAGARLLCGGPGDGRLLPACVLEAVPHDALLWREEVFGPVALLEAFDDFEQALAMANDSAYGLQAGVFSASLTHALRAWDALDVGGVIINDVPSFRVDNMPYGGGKRSGLGREGVRAAIEGMSETRLLVIRDDTA